MNRWSTSFLVGLTVAIAPTIAHPATAQTDAPKVTSSAVYQCDDGKGFTAQFRDDNSVRATFGSRVFVLPSVETASGARYSDGSVTISTKGKEAFVDVGENALFRNCVVTGSVQGLW